MSEATVKIHFINGGLEKTVDYQAGHTLLDIAIINQLDPPYSCMEGDCSNCSARLEEGQVSGENSGGMILTCQTKPAPGCSFLKVRY